MSHKIDIVDRTVKTINIEITFQDQTTFLVLSLLSIQKQLIKVFFPKICSKSKLLNEKPFEEKNTKIVSIKNQDYM